MGLWLAILVLSALAGALCAFVLRGKIGLVSAAAVPWFGLLFWQLYMEYVAPYQGGGASMWLVAQLFAGTIAAITGLVVYAACKRFTSSIV